MIILRKQGRQYDKLGRNCVVLGIIASGFAIGMDYVNSTYDIPMIEDYLNPNGMFDILRLVWWYKRLCLSSSGNCILYNC